MKALQHVKLSRRQWLAGGIGAVSTATPQHGGTMRHARHIFAITLIGAAALTGCSGEKPIGTPTAPALVGTPITVELPFEDGRAPAITWEVVVDSVEPSPMHAATYANVKQALDWHPELTCWAFTATLTQIDGPPAGTELNRGLQVPHLRANLANGEETSTEDGVCVNAASTDASKTWLASFKTAPGPGNSVQVYYEAATETPEPPASVQVEVGWKPGEWSYAYVSIPPTTD